MNHFPLMLTVNLGIQFNVVVKLSNVINKPPQKNPQKNPKTGTNT